MRQSISTALALLALTTISGPTLAGPGHDHGDAPATVVGVDRPQRLPDASVFLPKRTQRQLDVRTLTVEAREVPRTVTLAGRVVIDPNAGGRVQSTQAGRIESGPRGLPSLGQRVSKGEVLAYVQPAIPILEASNQRAQIADLRAQRDLAERRLARLKLLEGTVATKDVEAAESELRSFGERLAAVQMSVSTRETLTAPVSGVVTIASVVAGQVVDAREIVFEIVDPTRMRVEALAYDAALAGDIAAATIQTSDGRSIPLEFAGASAALRDQALPLAFRLKPGTAVIAIGQPVTVIAQTRSKIAGIPVPASSLVKSASNEDIVWVHEAPERFVERRVRFAALDGATITIISGVKAGERVVVQSAPLVNQVR